MRYTKPGLDLQTQGSWAIGVYNFPCVNPNHMHMHLLTLLLLTPFKFEQGISWGLKHSCRMLQRTGLNAWSIKVFLCKGIRVKNGWNPSIIVALFWKFNSHWSYWWNRSWILPTTRKAGNECHLRYGYYVFLYENYTYISKGSLPKKKTGYFMTSS